jgi:trimeric autotransporter adhesin
MLVIKGRLRPEHIFQFVFFLHLVVCHPHSLLGQAPGESVAAASSGRAIHGVVKSGNMPIPGAGVSATNAATKEQINTWTDVDGSYRLRIPADGSYTVRVQMAAFAESSQEVILDPTHQDVLTNFELILLSRAREAAHENDQRRTNAGANANGRGFQSLPVFQSGAGQDAAGGSMSDVVPSGMPVPGIAPDSATESVAVSGNTSNSFNAMSADEMQQRFNDARQQGGGFGGGAGFGGQGSGFGGGGFGGGGFGRRGFDINRPHGSLYYGVGDSALNASPFSLTGQPTEKPAYLQNSFGGSVGGPLNIPHIYHGGSKTFYFINYNGKRAENPFDQFSTVPTLQERQGNFSGVTYTSGPQEGQPVELFNPTNNTPYPGNIIPGFSLQTCPTPPGPSSAVAGLLQYIPCPNLPGSFQNFHFVTSATSNTDDLNIRLNRSFGAAPAGGRRGGGRNAPRNSLTFGFHYHGSSANLTNPFPSVGGNTSVRSFDVPVSYTRSIGKLTNIVRADFNRSRTRTQNLYAFSNDITSALGITGVSQNPFDWGLPNLSFTDFASLQDTTPLLTRNQTYTFSDNVIWNHGKHTWRWGGDFRRVQVNTETDGNPRGSFVFTGLNTSEIVGGTPVAGTGYDFADFLLGLPQQTTVQFGDSNHGNHFRGNFWDLYVQDEWKMRGNLTLNLGVRYEYVSPLTEINNLITNLDLSPGVLNPAVPLGAVPVTPIQPGQSGPDNGPLPASLVRPDRNNFAPRIGFAWKPFSKTVVRGGYGINYNTGAYQGIALQLALQPPNATTATNIQTAPGELTLQSGFPAPAGVTNNYAVNPNYRLGYVQIRNLDIQQQIRPTLLLNIDYTGTKGTDLDILEAPNRTPTGIRIPPSVQVVDAFTYESSVADSEANAGSVRLRKRLAKGFSIGGIYTFSKSLDDASSIGAGATSAASTPGLGGGGTGAGGGGGGSSGAGSSGGGAANVAQNPFNLSAERGLSSFNQTHKFTADYLLELPFGHDKRWLTENTPARAIFGDWQWSGDWTIASGLPFTPRLLGDINDVNAGTNGTLRADLVPGRSVSLANHSIAEWFNTSAFVAPPAGQYGNARRNSIIGPGSKVFDMAFTKLVPLKESRMLEFRAQATNIFNIPNYSSIDTTVNSPTFGRVTAAGAMRQFTITSRFRF